MCHLMSDAPHSFELEAQHTATGPSRPLNRSSKDIPGNQLVQHVLRTSLISEGKASTVTGSCQGVFFLWTKFFLVYKFPEPHVRLIGNDCTKGCKVQLGVFQIVHCKSLQMHCVDVSLVMQTASCLGIINSQQFINTTGLVSKHNRLWQPSLSQLWETSQLPAAMTM